MSETKDPRLVDAGKRGALKRWGPPKTVSLAGLPAEQRAFLAELIETAKRNAALRERAAG